MTLQITRTIIGTAIPKITYHFHSIDDIGWYAIAFFLPECSFMLMFGKTVPTLFHKIGLFPRTCITIFEIGSAICGAAPTPPPGARGLIIGRAVAGLGSAGLFSGTVLIIVHNVPLQKRPLSQRLFGAVFGIPSIIGPLLGGASTDKVLISGIEDFDEIPGFYINLPIGAVVIVGLFFLLHINGSRTSKPLTPRQQISQIDPTGTAIFLPCTISSILLLAFIGDQIWNGQKATVPPQVLNQRSVASAFQSIKGVSVVNSGIRTIALVLELVIGNVLSDMLTTRTGYYTPSMIIGSVILSTGAGLLTTWDVNTERTKWIGYQVIYGFGVGRQLSLSFFAQTLGGAGLVSVAQNVFAVKLQDYVSGIERINVGAVIRAGATVLRDVVSGGFLRQVLGQFNEALVKTFLLGLR
ncbi:MFS general substrate transporter [Zopfia rhizophila CBS 207.26]|uniref:MFS general substrate transporter n=1 Tax=Zopfia rhizophila CBS 207.26 TaxID=1314779 RepID=A0A6A6E5F1_9PEZI|nr:MFS general substrate transporter [Zopfia rhizophila CBS 207.26]